MSERTADAFDFDLSNRQNDKITRMIDNAIDKADFLQIGQKRHDAKANAMKNGANGTMTISKIATGTNDELSFEIYGDKGALKFNLMDANYLYHFDNTQKEEVFGGERGFKKIECVQRFDAPAGIFPSSKSSIGWLRGHVHCLYNFLNSVYENKKSAPNVKDGAYVNYIMDLMYKSAKENKTIDCK